MRKISLTIFVILFVCGCRREYKCTNETFGITFIGYQRADYDTIIVKRYQANTNFQQLIDSAVTTPGNASYLENNDTAMILYVSPLFGIQYGYDWQIYVPGINKIVSISSIMAMQNSGSCTTGIGVNTHCYCVNPVQSANVDGQMIIYPTPDATFQGYKIYIKY